MPSAKSGSGAWRVTSPHSYHVALGFGVSREIVGKKRRWFPFWEGKNHHREHRGHRERRVRGNRGLALGSSLPMLQHGTKSPTYPGGRDMWAVGVQDLPRPTPRCASRRTGHPATSTRAKFVAWYCLRSSTSLGPSVGFPTVPTLSSLSGLKGTSTRALFGSSLSWAAVRKN